MAFTREVEEAIRTECRGKGMVNVQVVFNLLDQVKGLQREVALLSAHAFKREHAWRDFVSGYVQDAHTAAGRGVQPRPDREA